MVRGKLRVGGPGILATLCLVAAMLTCSAPAAHADRAAAISVGIDHACALTIGGGVKCWGLNSSGQLGDGSTANSPVPVDVTGLSSGVAAISAGHDHTCAVTTAGGAKCWGNNAEGELGDGSTANSPVPVDVTGLSSGVAAISAGYDYTCAVTTGGGAKCWGYNGWGRLGDGTETNNSTTPVDVSGLSSGVASISAGGGHTCAVTTGGCAKCWGYNGEEGQLGIGSTSPAYSTTPVDVSGLSSGVAEISAGGEHTCALTTGGGMKCWGYNGYGALGDGTTENRLTPVTVSGLSSGVASISSGFWHTCAVIAAGEGKCWGQTATGTVIPVGVTGLPSGVDSISADGHTCAVTTAGRAYCWGSNPFGELGNGTTTDSSAPVNVIGLPYWTVTITGKLTGWYDTSGEYPLFHIGSSVRFRATVSPNLAGESVDFGVWKWRKSSSTWEQVRSRLDVMLDPTSRAGISIRTERLGKGRFRVRCSFAGDPDHLPSDSPFYRYKVTR